MNNSKQHIDDTTLAAQVCHSLQQQSQQASDFDNTLNLLAQQAKQARINALNTHSSHKKQWLWLGGSLAMAACVAMITLTPLNPNNAVAPTHYAAIQESTVPSVDPQFLEDMDMLMALGEES